jgi:chromosomal replication initiator protein
MVAIREFETQPTDLFSETLQSLKRRLSLFVWQGFFEPLSFVSLEHDTLCISAPSSFHKDWVQNHYLVELQESASKAFGRALKVALIEQTGDHKPEPVVQFIPELPSQSISPLKAFQQTPGIPQGPIVLESVALNPANTFDTFVPGPSNSMGFAACNAVAEQPGAQYSPLFLFGPVGIGKTHLIQAIGLYALSKNPNVKILYMSAEQWVNAYILAIREKRFDAFRKKFRTDCDILLIDDIQFLAGKDASQDEFFHTFNSLHQAHKQIVVTSDKYPHEIEGLEERLQTRLSWGLIADIRPPELETRRAILDKKAAKFGITLPPDVSHYLASQVTTSVRELEGALLRLSAFLSVTKSEVTLAAVKEFLSPVFRRTAGQLSADKICEHVAAYYDLKPLELKGQNRQRQVALARQIAMALCRSMMSFSLPEIGRLFGGRDHTTVLSSIRKIDELRESDIGLQTVLSRLEKSLIESC